ncbi:DUF4861 domain-containing protein [Pontibacter beigongshangensis]|uniref:DUF4861 domain-containing protein n=1 Tax=Pontibacter beigongshangensis TaxID=2574733 RepID=UPI0016507BA9|nr:DUF4861 domain-containing protein [Pontibacter beigongshangensis]
MTHKKQCIVKAFAGSIWLSALLLSGCQLPGKSMEFKVMNKLPIDRPAEPVSIPVASVAALVQRFGVENLLLYDAATDSLLVTQPLDANADGTVDELLFQASLKARQEKSFKVKGTSNGAAQQPKSGRSTFSRFVPERTDDYTWENDRVAFRTYGPVAQQMVEQGIKGGTLTSGIDAWLKRVEYPIINKWYEGYKENSNFYHVDRGEGYDPYHVGVSRGIGGVGVLAGDSLYVSRNFTGYKTIAEGPIRTVFELTYAPWQAGEQQVQETKRISLDLGSNMTRIEEVLSTAPPLPNITIGITLHDKKGEVKASREQGWFRYWEPIDGSWLGTGLVVAPQRVQSFKDHRAEARDQSHLLVVASPKDNLLVYYAGFGWDKSGQFESVEEWDLYLADFAKRLASPLEIKFQRAGK